MATDELKRADAFVKAHKGDNDLHPDLAAVIGTYSVLRDDGRDSDAAVHARAMLQRADTLGYDTDPKPAKQTAAKKSTAKKTAKKS